MTCITRSGWVNSLWPSYDTWQHRSGSTLDLVMAWCLMAPSDFLSQCWLFTYHGVLWHSSKSNSRGTAPEISVCKMSIVKLLPHLSGANGLMQQDQKHSWSYTMQGKHMTFMKYITQKAVEWLITAGLNQRHRPWTLALKITALGTAHNLGEVNWHIFSWNDLAHFNNKKVSYQFKDSHYKDEMVVRMSLLYNVNSYTGKTVSLYWNGSLQTSLMVATKQWIESQYLNSGWIFISCGIQSIQIFIMSISRLEAMTKRLFFSRQHFQMHFCERKYTNCD